MSDNSSENSLVKNEVPGDLNFKYNRLAAEYSKLRAQNGVLKKAVLDEQSKTVEFNEVVRSKDQIIRKVDQEMEALKFRNSQLSVRLTVLQQEIDALNNKNGKKKSKKVEVSNGIVNNTFLDAEIEKTMIEHAKLISELSEKDEKHEEEVKALKNEIYCLNYEAEQKDTKLKQFAQDHQTTIEELKRNHQEIKRNYANIVVKLKEAEVELTTLKKVHKSYVDEVGPKLEVLTQLLPKKNPFLDEEQEILNKLNVRYSPPLYNEDCHVKTFRKCFSTLLLTFYNIIHNVTLDLAEMGFGELNLYIKTLLKEDDGILLRDKLSACYHLLDNIGLESSNVDSMESAVFLLMKTFLHLLVSINSSYFNETFKERSNSSNNHSGSNSVKDALEMFQIRKNELVVKMITIPNSQHSLIHDEFENLNTAIKELISAANNIDEKRLESNACKSEDTFEFKKRATAYLRSLKKEPTERIPYEEGLNNKIKLQEYVSLCNSLKDEIKIMEETISSLEQEKLHNQNEDQLKEMKLLYDDIEASHLAGDFPQEMTTELGKFISPHKIPVEVLVRVTELQRHTNQKLNDLIIEKQNALSKARNYILECKALQRRMEYCQVEKQLLEQQLLKSKESSTDLREELNTVNQNYEVQLSMMSEHLANVNDRLATQTEEIDRLHHQLNTKVSKKSKPK